MTLPELKTMLESTGLPVAYRAWPEGCAPALPFICYFSTGSSNLPADSGVFYSYDNVRVELYTQHKDLNAEAVVETALSGFHWENTEIYISAERCYMILYEIEV